MILINWSIDSTDPTIQQNVQLLFFGVIVLIVAVAAVIFHRIGQRKDNGTVMVPVETGSTKLEPVSFAVYDLRKLRELLLSKVIIPGIITYLIFLKWQVLVALIFQSINNPIMVFNSELFQIYILGKPATLERARPWAEPAAMPEWLTKMMPTAEPEKPKKS